MFLQSENGVLGRWTKAPEGQEDWDLVNAGKQPIALLPGAAFFDHASSFAMMRGGHLDICVLGAFQVSEEGDLVIGGSMIEPYVKSGRLKGLAVSSDVRLVSLPDVPTFKELGIKDIQAHFVFGFVAPKGTPADIVSKIAKDATAVLRDPEFKSKNVDPFALVPTGSTPGEFAEYLKKERPVQQKRVADSGLQLEF